MESVRRVRACAFLEVLGQTERALLLVERLTVVDDVHPRRAQVAHVPLRIVVQIAGRAQPVLPRSTHTAAISLISD